MPESISFYLPGSNWFVTKINHHVRNTWQFPSDPKQHIETQGEPEFLWVLPGDVDVPPERVGIGATEWTHITVAQEGDFFYLVAEQTGDFFYTIPVLDEGDFFYLIPDGI